MVFRYWGLSLVCIQVKTAEKLKSYRKNMPAPAGPFTTWRAHPGYGGLYIYPPRQGYRKSLYFKTPTERGFPHSPLSKLKIDHFSNHELPQYPSNLITTTILYKPNLNPIHSIPHKQLLHIKSSHFHTPNLGLHQFSATIKEGRGKLRIWSPINSSLITSTSNSVGKQVSTVFIIV